MSVPYNYFIKCHNHHQAPSAPAGPTTIKTESIAPDMEILSADIQLNAINASQDIHSSTVSVSLIHNASNTASTIPQQEVVSPQLIVFATQDSQYSSQDTASNAILIVRPALEPPTISAPPVPKEPQEPLAASMPHIQKLSTGKPPCPPSEQAINGLPM